MKSVVSGAKFYKFETVGQTLFGRLGNPVLREKAGQNPGEEIGSIMGYEITDKHGEIHIVGSSHAIKKAVESGLQKGDILRIIFKGKTQNAKGQPVNTFSIDLLDSEAEWNELDPLPEYVAAIEEMEHGAGDDYPVIEQNGPEEDEIDGPKKTTKKGKK